MQKPKSDLVLFIIVAAALVGATVYLLVLAIGGAELVDVGDLGTPDQPQSYEPLPWLVVIALAGSAALALWWRERGLIGKTGLRDRAAAAAANAKAAALERAREAERTMHREFNARLGELTSKRGHMGDPEDVPSLVLRTALHLLEAEKGLLVSRSWDGSRAGKPIAAEGFDHDPADSAVAKRFAEEVIERDTIVHARGGEIEEAQRTPADEEIENLVAIPIYVQDEFNGVVVCANSENFDDRDEGVLVALGDHAGAVLHHAEQRGRMRGTFLATVRMLAAAIAARSVRTAPSEQLCEQVARVARRLSLEPRRREQLVLASLLYDVGKLEISESILLKPGELTEQEYAAVQVHPEIGSHLVEQVAELAPLSESIRHHHERFDGGGYPSGLERDEIPIESRVLAVVDAFGAMTSDRPYRARMSVADACEEIERCAGTQFDPEVARLFVEEVRRGPGAGEAQAQPDSSGSTRSPISRASGSDEVAAGEGALRT